MVKMSVMRSRFVLVSILSRFYSTKAKTELLKSQQEVGDPLLKLICLMNWAMQSQLLQQSQHHKKHTWQIVFKLRLTRELRDLSNLFWRNVIDRLSSLNSFSKSSPTLASLTTSPPALAAFNLAEKSIKWKSNATYMKSRNLRRFKTFHGWKIALILSQNFPWIFYVSIASCLYFPAHFWVPKMR